MFSRFAHQTLRSSRSAVRPFPPSPSLPLLPPPSSRRSRSRHPPRQAAHLTRPSCSQGQSARSYATSATASTSSSAPYFLGAGIAGSAVFYLSTRDQRLQLQEAKTGAAKSAAQGVKQTEDGGVKVQGESALSNDEFRDFKLAEVIPYNQLRLPAGLCVPAAPLLHRETDPPLPLPLALPLLLPLAATPRASSSTSRTAPRRA